MFSRKYKVYFDKTSSPWYTVVSGWIFSNFGMFCINLLYAILGKNLQMTQVDLNLILFFLLWTHPSPQVSLMYEDTTQYILPVVFLGH